MWRPVIGLEIHSRLLTKHKLFSKASTNLHAAPNHNLSEFDLGLPGSLPKLNLFVIELATRLALAMNSTISPILSFDRKHYFYPDLPNGYQITQKWNPFAIGGELDGIAMEQIQIEQDTAKMLQGGLLDHNRAGLPILEIVTKPMIHSSQQAVSFLKKMQQILWYHDISCAVNDDGSFRCDVNISVSKDNQLGTRTELKHLHKLSSISLAIDYEINRQIEILEGGGVVQSETRGFDQTTGKTFTLRSKESQSEYYFMKDADIPPVLITEKYIKLVSESMKEPLNHRIKRLLALQIPSETVEIMVSQPHIVDYFDSTLSFITDCKPSKVATWIIVELKGNLNAIGSDISNSPVEPQRLAELINIVSAGEISPQKAKLILKELMHSEKSVLDLMIEKGWQQNSDTDYIKEICLKVISENPKTMEKIRKGKSNSQGYLIGQVIKQSNGKANPKLVAETLQNILIQS